MVRINLLIFHQYLSLFVVMFEADGGNEGKFVHCVESGMQSRVVVEWGPPTTTAVRYIAIVKLSDMF